MLIPDDALVPEALVADEMLSKASVAGKDAADYIIHTLTQDPRALVQSQGCRALSLMRIIAPELVASGLTVNSKR